MDLVPDKQVVAFEACGLIFPLEVNSLLAVPCPGMIRVCLAPLTCFSWQTSTFVGRTCIPKTKLVERPGSQASPATQLVGLSRLRSLAWSALGGGQRVVQPLSGPVV